MFSRTAAELEAFSSSSQFEHLCGALLLPEYRDLVPIGGSGDRGRDAKATFRTATDDEKRPVVLQYSVQKTWEAKLKNELAKVKEQGFEPQRYVSGLRIGAGQAARS